MKTARANLMQLIPLIQKNGTGRLNTPINPLELIGRHVQLDPGSLDADDRAANERALNEGLRIFSAFEYSGVRYWVITGADRSATTLLLPDEY